MKMTVMIQFVGHVIHAAGAVTYRAVEIELTGEQVKMLKLQQDEFFGAIAIEEQTAMTATSIRAEVLRNEILLQL